MVEYTDITAELMQQAIDRGTRTSVPANGGINKWLHKYMLVVPGVGGLHVVTEPWTEPPSESRLLL